MDILKRQLALLLVLAMTLTMLPMPAYADEVTEPESPSAIVEESTGKPMESKEEVPTDTANKPAEKAEPDTTAKGTAAPAAETPKDNKVNSDTSATEETVTDMSEDAHVSDSVEESEESSEVDNTDEENADSDSTVESEEDSITDDNAESDETADSDVTADVSEETNQMEPETDAPAFATFSFRRSVVNAASTDCDHPETEIAWDTKDQVINCKPISDTQHQISGYQYRYCTSCYQRVGESFAAEELQDHEPDSDDNCSMCGYISGCAHANTRGEWIYGSTPPSFSQYNDRQHKVTGYQYIYCTSCHETLNDRVYQEGQLEDHYMRGGMCPYCSYSCPHTTTATVWDSDYPVTYSQYSSTQHKYQGYQYTYCTYCLEQIGESFAAEKLEDHTTNDSGTCSKCWYNDDCDHEIIWENDNLSTTGVIDDNQHRVTYWKYPYCSKCEQTLGDSVRQPEIIEDHVFGDDDWCDVCHFRKNCPHENTSEEMNRGVLPGYRSISDTQHVMFVYYYDHCWDCDKRVSEDRTVDTSDIRDHELDNSGVCTSCGYGSTTDSGCAHTNVVGTISSLDPPRYEQNNETQHLVWHTMYDRCLDCNEIVSEGTEAVTGEDHVLNEKGQCAYCGYGMGEGYCTHPASDVMWSNAPMTYTSLNEEQHQVEGCQYHYCTSCYKRISADFPVAEWEDHTFDATGDCTLCNYRVGCAHSETTMRLYNTLYESLNKDSHEVTRLYSKVCANEECGKVLVSVETSYTETETEDHDFEGNTCPLCNYTVAAQLQVTVNQTINTEDHISVTANVVGGTGGYKFSWKILKDGSIASELPVSSSASCGTAPWSAGSYVFEVTVEDSSGNTVTAQSSAFTVGGHTCEFKPGSSTQLVNQSLTHHTVEITTYEECNICHEKRNEVTDVEWVEHTPVDAESYGHEAAHPHKKYFICECGAHPYLEGQFHTANGEVQEESVCCICHGHKYGEEEETPEGTRQKTCENCGLATVTHIHDYKLVKTTKLVIQSETHHTVETTTYEECSTCHKKTEPVEDVTWEEHKSESTSHEAGHPHQKYSICKCGAHPYIDGEYETANGKVQEKSVCCICNGHKYGEAKEAADGTWKKTCANCGLSQKVAAPVQPTEPEENTCDHIYNLEGDGTKHPHTIKRVCMRCKAEESFNYTFFDCCQCVGHDWSEVVRLPDGKTYQIGCFRCKESQKVAPSAQIENFYGIVDIITERHDAAKQYQEEHEIDSASSAIWKTIAGQAANILTEIGFVATNEALDSASSAINLVGIQKAVNDTIFSPETWDEQQTDIWKSLIAQMLQKENELEDVESYTDLADDISDFISDGKKVLKAFNLAGSKHAKIDLLAKVAGMFAEGTSRAAEADEYNKIIAQLRVNEKNIEILQEIIDAAEASGNRNLVNAACELQSDLKKANEQKTDQLIHEGQAFLTGFAEKGFEWAINEIQKEGLLNVFGETDVTGVLNYLAIIAIAARATDWVLGWGPIYDEAQTLMTLNVMDSNMNIADVLKTEDSPYMAKLWGVLQVEGCNHAQELLSAVEDARDRGTRADLVALASGSPALMTVEVWKHIFGINLEDDFGIDEGGLFGKNELPDVLKDLDKERDYHIDALDLPLE